MRLLLPLDRARRLRGHVVDEPVDAGDLVDDTVGDPLEQVVRQARPIRRHGVLARDRPQDDGIPVGPLVAHHADGPYGRKDREALPDFVIPIAIFHFLHDDGVGIAENFAPFWGYFAKNTDGEAAAGEWLPVNNLLGQTQFQAELAHFVLEQAFQRLDQLELHVPGQAAHVMVALDHGRRVAGNRHRLDHVGIKRALREKHRLARTLRRRLKHVDERPSDNLPLALRIGDTPELGQEHLGGVLILQFDFVYYELSRVKFFILSFIFNKILPHRAENIDKSSGL